MKPDRKSQSAPAEGLQIILFGREVMIVPNGSGRGRHTGRRGPRSRFTPAVVAKLRRQAKRTPVAELARRNGVSPQYIYFLVGRKSPKSDAHGWRWTRAEDKLVRTLTVAEAVARTGRSVAAVRSRRRHLGVAVRTPPYTLEEDMMIIRLPTAEAAAKTGRSPQSIYARRKFLGIRVGGGNAGRVK